jgi:cytokinesis protein
MHNFQISMAKFSSYSVEDVVQMIIHCDVKILDDNVVMEFLQKNDFCDIPDNTAKLMAPYSKDWTGPNPSESKREQDPNELTREDQIYLFTAYELHFYWKSRMRALALTRTFEHEYDEISNKLLEISRVADSLRSSSSLISVLGLILDIGNFMNDANKQANGFKLSTLGRLGMLKDDKNESTFADVVERIVRNQYPGWEGFTDEINGVITAQKINVEQLQTDAKKYIDNIKNVQMSLDAGNLSDPTKFHPEDKVSIIVQRNMKEARRKAEQLQVFLEDMQKNYDDIMAFYGEDPTDDSSRRDFFAKLANFVLEWRVSDGIRFFLCKANTTTEIQGQEHVARRAAPSQRDFYASQAAAGRPAFAFCPVRLGWPQVARQHWRHGRPAAEAACRQTRSARPTRSPQACPPQGSPPGARRLRTADSRNRRQYGGRGWRRGCGRRRGQGCRRDRYALAYERDRPERDEHG